MIDITKMNLKEKLGQLLFVGFDGYEYNDHLKTIIEEYKVGNIILFTRNIQDLEQLSKLNKKIHQEIYKHTKIMPFISIDQEGGLVTRIMKTATFAPGAMTIAATKLENAYKVGEILGEELTYLGINMNLAPTLDVNNNPNNPVIGVRSYGDNPQSVSEFGLNFIKGLQSKGIVATAKHFPGHGDVEVDSHLGLPVVDHDKERLNNVELYPFKQVLNDVDAIMSAHIFFKAYEQESLPATLSKKVLTDLLRNDLGYKGLIVSDCMEMKAIDDIYTTALGVKMGIIAGLDMAFISHSLEKQIQSLKLLEDAYLNGEITMEAIDEKVLRVLKFKEKTRKVIEENFINNVNNLKYFENDSNRNFAQKVVDDSLTIFKGERFYPVGKTLLIATAPFATTIAEDQLDTRSIIDAVKREIPNIDTYKLELNKVDEEILKIVGDYDNVVVCSYNANIYKNQAMMINLINARAKKLFVLSTRNPYDYLAIDNVDNYALVYEYTPNSVRTIVKYLKGELAPSGKLPVKLEKKFKAMASLYIGLEEYPLDENIKYLSFLKESKIEYVFISAHMPEMHANAMNELDVIIKEANRLGIKIILDVSKRSVLEFGIPEGIYSLRLDYGFKSEEVLEFGDKNFLVELNASVIKESDLLYLINNGFPREKLRISHNFYPKPYTGLSLESVKAKNDFYKKLGFKIMAYIPSKFGKRPPLKEGLPTCEIHRKSDLVSALSDLNYLNVDEVCFGDAYASLVELQTLVNFRRDILVVPINVYKGISQTELEILKRTHFNRSDSNDYFVRSSVRVHEPIIEFNTTIRSKKMVTIDNRNFLRYQGEVGIMKTDLPRDNKVNVVGVALISDYLLERIKPNQKFIFEIRGEIEWKK